MPANEILALAMFASFIAASSTWRLTPSCILVIMKASRSASSSPSARAAAKADGEKGRHDDGAGPHGLPRLHRHDANVGVGFVPVNDRLGRCVEIRRVHEASLSVWKLHVFSHCRCRRSLDSSVRIACLDLDVLRRRRLLLDSRVLLHLLLNHCTQFEDRDLKQFQ